MFDGWRLSIDRKAHRNYEFGLRYDELKILQIDSNIVNKCEVPALFTSAHVWKLQLWVLSVAVDGFYSTNFFYFVEFKYWMLYTYPFVSFKITIVLNVKYIWAGRSQQTRDHTCNIGWRSYSHWLCHSAPRRAHKNGKFHVECLIHFFVFLYWIKNDYRKKQVCTVNH